MKYISRLLIYSLLTTILLLSCNSEKNKHRDGDIVFLRYEQVIFDSAEKELPQRLAEFKNQFKSPLLNIFPDDQMFMEQLRGFIADGTVRDIYNITENRYHNLYWLEKEISDALNKAHRLDKEIDFTQFSTFVSGFFDYSQRIIADRDSKSLLVSIDQYALGDMEKYSYFGLPMFIVERCDSAFLASDVMAEIARQYIASPSEENLTMLDLMISEGKVLYFLDLVMPDKSDNLKIRYNDDQMQWVKNNESNIWTYFIHNNLLYEKDFARYHNFVDEAPKTNAFKDSAPRTTEYIGWQIVRKYMENSNSSLKELFDNTNSQAILQASKYKP